MSHGGRTPEAISLVRDHWEQVQQMFYRMEGWEKYWPYEKRPAWLRRLKYPDYEGMTRW